MQKEVEYHNDVAKEINRWASIDPSAVVDLKEDRIATLSRNEVAKCCVDRKSLKKSWVLKQNRMFFMRLK
jgi:hypothetical protein